METWKLKPTVYVGSDSSNLLKDLKNKKIFIVNDSFLLDIPYFKELVHSLERHNKVELFTDVVPDPPVELVVKGIEKISEFLPNIVIAFGGGSAIDLAKGVVFMAKQTIDIELDEFIAIPTTSGTGSEVTNIAVITDNQNHVKYPLADDSLLPTMAILDYNLTKSAPDSVVVYSGLDVLTHALEALVARDATPYTDAIAEKAIEYVFKYLENSYNKVDDDLSKKRMHEASCLAGMAFNDAGLGICHAIAHQIGAQFKVIHGLANAILLPHIVKFNAKNSQEAKTKYANVSRKLDIAHHYSKDESAVELLISEINKLALALESPRSLSAAKVDLEQAEVVEESVINNAYKDITTAYNPVEVTKDDLRGIYRGIFR
jgi:1-propanol dehydrogenase